MCENVLWVVKPSFVGCFFAKETCVDDIIIMMMCFSFLLMYAGARRIVRSDLGVDNPIACPLPVQRRYLVMRMVNKKMSFLSKLVAVVQDNCTIMAYINPILNYHSLISYQNYYFIIGKRGHQIICSLTIPNKRENFSCTFIIIICT